MRGWSVVALLMGILLATSLAAQGPRIEPPASGIFGPFPGSGQSADPSIPPSVPNKIETPELIVDLSRPRVSITSAFQGESILLFGMFVLRKRRVLGMWLNTSRQEFDDVPAYYSIAASQPLQRLLARSAGGEILSLEDRLQSVRSVGQREHEDLIRFRLGLVEVKRREGLYPAAIGQVTIQANRLFRVDLPFPSRLPEGTYEVRTYLLRDGRIAAAVSRPLPVGKVGFSAQLAGWADNDGPLYGLGAIVMALLVGWIGGVVMRRI